MTQRNLLIALALLVMPLVTTAQEDKVINAAISAQAGDLEAAKKDIDAAYTHPQTASSSKMLYWRGKIYGLIYNQTKASSDLFTASDAYLRFIEQEKASQSKKFRAEVSEAKEALAPYMAFGLYTAGVEAYNEKKYDVTLTALPMVIKIIPYDKDNVLLSNRISDTGLYELMAEAAYLSTPKKCNLVYENYNKLLSMNYARPDMYLIIEDCYIQEEKDTAKALETIARGRERFPNEKKLSDEELALYLYMGKQQELLGKLNSAIEKFPAEYTSYFLRANVYDRIISDLQKSEDMLKDSMETVKNKARTAKTPQQKTQLNNQAAEMKKRHDALVKEEEGYIKLAEADYRKCIDLTTASKKDSARADAYYNLAGLTLHKTRPVVDRMNETNVEANYKALSKVLNDYYKEAIGYLQQYESVKPDDEGVLTTIKQLYFKLGDKAKSDEYAKKAEEASKKKEKQ